MKWRYTVLFCGMALLPLSQTYAAETNIQSDQLIEGAKLCTGHLPRYEREYAIPTHLLSAIASTESGRFHDGLRLRLPWPWTINAAGKSYYYDTKYEAIAAVKKLHARGIQSIDVGCMQVNIYHHPDAFASLDEAFEPQSNIAYAAGFLRSLYNSDGTWKKAAADYHSKTRKLGNEYVGQVYDSWYQIIEKLRAARLQVPDSSITALNEMKGKVLHKTLVASEQSFEEYTTPLPEQEGRKVTAHTHPHLNSIKISGTAPKEEIIETAFDTTRESQIIVVRPDLTPEANTADSSPLQLTAPLAMAQAKPAIADDSQMKIIHINDSRPVEISSTVGHRNGPNFIFND